MFTLIEYNEFYKDNLIELKKCKIEPILLFNISYNNKIQFKKDLQEILNLKDKLKSKYSAIMIKLLKIDNSTHGFVNSLKYYFNIVIGLGGMNKINRFFLEQTQIDLLADPQNTQYYNKIDFIHHFNSGLNHILCKVAKQNNISFTFTLNFFIDKRQVPKEVGRINQNLIFANKYEIFSNINFIVRKPSDVKSQKELISILSMFDISTIQKKKSLSILADIIEINQKQQSLKYVSESIKFE